MEKQSIKELVQKLSPFGGNLRQQTEKGGQV